MWTYMEVLILLLFVTDGLRLMQIISGGLRTASFRYGLILVPEDIMAVRDWI